MHSTRVALLCVVLVFCGLSSHSLQAAPSLLFPATVHSAPPINVELQLPLTQLQKLKPGESQAYEAQLTLADGTALALKVSPRGKSRRSQCSFPPLRLDFKKKATTGTVFAGQNKLKLVTHCSGRLARGGFLAAEMLTYRLFNLMTQASFRVRAVQVNYINTDKATSESWPGFVIEHKKALAERLGGSLLEVDKLEIGQLQPDYAALVSVFAYMVGNTDFSLRMGPGQECCHNAVPIQLEKVRVVPYDFDATGLVNAPYARPAPSMKIRRVTQRTFRGYCAHNDQLSAAAEKFVAKQADLLALVDEFDDIPGLKRERARKYLSAFFETVGASSAVDTKLKNRCR